MPGRGFGIGASGIHIPNENFREYTKMLGELYQSIKQTPENYSLKAFEKLFVESISDNITESKEVTEGQFAEFRKALQEKPTQELCIAKNIFGVHLLGAKEYNLGPYKIYQSQFYMEKLKEYPNSLHQVLECGIKSSYVVEAAVKCKDQDKAVELADVLFERLEKIVGFMIGYRNDRYDAGIINYTAWNGLSTYIRSNLGVGLNLRRQGALESVPLDEPFFIAKENGFAKIWEMVNKENPSELEKRILLSIEWVGQAIREKSPASAFLYAAIAMEILFNHSEKTIVNPSILSQISESIAIIVGNNVQGRLEIEGEAKRLYGLRSAIAHAGKSNISEVDIHSIIMIARETICAILTRESLQGIDSVAGLHKKIKEVKYGGPEI